METNLHDIARIAQTIGNRPDYVQGGGGNVSLKYDAAIMAVKASGFRLGDLRTDNGFVSIAYPSVRNFYDVPLDSEVLTDLTQASDANVTASILDTTAKRPSIETGFHAILGTCVIHTHSVYANVLTCTAEGAAIMAELFPTAVFVPYQTPGVTLTIAIKHAVADSNASIIFLKNHGIITVGDTPDAAYALHEYVTQTIRDYFSSTTTYPTLALAPTTDGFQSASPELRALITRQRDVVTTFADTTLFPDQIVYGEKVGFGEAGKAITIDVATGTITYAVSRGEALAFEETLAAWLTIIDMVTAAGLTLVTIPAHEGAIIANLESEKYRQAIL
jgi:rhamnose utilization protein RhaD (predicted bifunctional aldolase and dehydrogenase)